MTLRKRSVGLEKTLKPDCKFMCQLFESIYQIGEKVPLLT